MNARIRIYFEGNRQLKRGFAGFLSELREKAATAKIGWELVASGSRNEALKDFEIALRRHKNDIIALLVDAEGLVLSDSVWEHLASLPDAALQKPKGAKDKHAHLMVQVMESWFLADKETLKAYYGQGFRESCLLETSNIENVSKDTVLQSLKKAVADTKKGEYLKTRHAADLLSQIDSNKVRRSSKNCERLFMTIEDAIEAESK